MSQLSLGPVNPCYFNALFDYFLGGIPIYTERIKVIPHPFTHSPDKQKENIALSVDSAMPS